MNPYDTPYTIPIYTPLMVPIFTRPLPVASSRKMRSASSLGIRQGEIGFAEPGQNSDDAGTQDFAETPHTSAGVEMSIT